MVGGGTASNPLPAGVAEATWLKAGAAEVQPSGTDNGPSEAARPTPAVTAASLGEPKVPVPEPQLLLSADPNPWNPLPNTVVADPVEFTSEPAEPSIEATDVDIDADEAAPDTRLVPEVTAVDDVTVDKDDSGDDDETEVAADDASPCNALGTAAEVSGVDNTEPSGVDTAEVSGDTTCKPVPADVLAACVTAPASPANPAELVVSSGVVNGANVDAAAAAPA